MTDTSKPPIDIGIPEEVRVEIASELGRLLADTYLWTVQRFHREHEPPAAG